MLVAWAASPIADCLHAVQVRELCAYVEKAHGMNQGWLLSAPQARVSLFVQQREKGGES